MSCTRKRSSSKRASFRASCTKARRCAGFLLPDQLSSLVASGSPCQSILPRSCFNAACSCSRRSVRSRVRLLRASCIDQSREGRRPHNCLALPATQSVAADPPGSVRPHAYRASDDRRDHAPHVRPDGCAIPWTHSTSVKARSDRRHAKEPAAAGSFAYDNPTRPTRTA